MLAGTEQDRPHRKMQLVDQRGAQILANGGHAAPEAHVTAACGGLCLLQGGVYALGDKTEFGAPRHPDRRPRVMRQHEDGRVIWRLVTPPALPAVVRPRAPDGTEHVAAKDPRADSGKALLRNAVIDSRLPAVFAVHLPPNARVEEPLHQLGATNAERLLKILARPGALAVDGDREALGATCRRHDSARSIHFFTTGAL